MEPRGSMLHSQELSNNPYSESNQPNSSVGSKTQSDASEQMFLQCVFVSPMLNPQAGGPLLVGCPQLVIQYIHS